MKTKTIHLILVVCTMLMFCSCDENKKKVVELTNQFIIAVNNDDRANIYDIYPNAQTVTNMRLVGHIDDGEVFVERDDSTGLYTATIQNQRQQKLEFSVDSLGKLSVIDSYGILQLDSLPRELALKCGVPLKRVSDMGQTTLMDESSLFISYLKEQNAFTVYGTLRYRLDGSYTWGVRGGYTFCEVRIPIENFGSKSVDGSEYSIEVKCYASNNPDGVTIIKTFDGETISPNEIRTFEIYEPGLYNWACERNLNWNVDIKYHNNSFIDRLLNYGKFTGEEFNQFTDIQEDYLVTVKGKPVLAKNEKKGHVDCYAEPSKDSKITGTAYHRQTIFVVSDEKLQDWGKAYKEPLKSEHYILLGYIHSDEWEIAGALSPLYINKITTKSKNGNEIAIYEKASTKSKIVKKVKSGGTLSISDCDDNYDFVIVYEADGHGGYKIIGYMQSVNVLYDEM